jgi:hypothetical protein
MLAKKNIILSTKKEKPSKEIKDTVVVSVKKIITSLGFADFLLEWIPGTPANKLLISVYCTNEDVEMLKDKLSHAPLIRKYSKILSGERKISNKTGLVRQ